MTKINAITPKISKSLIREYRNASAVIIKLLYADIKIGKITKYPNNKRKITNIRETSNLFSESFDPDLPIEVYHDSNKLLLNKFSSVKAPSRFTVSWSAEKENLRVEDRFL
jgi:hypothetical protein